MSSRRAHLRPRDIYTLKVRGWEKVFRANGVHKKAEVAILISHKIDFKTKTIIRDKGGHYIMIKGLIQEEDITIIYAPNMEVPQYVRQILINIKGEIDSNTIIVWDFSTLFPSMERSSEQKINKETQTLNDTLGKLDFIDIYRAFYPKAADYSGAHRTLSMIDYMLCCKASHRKFKKIEIIKHLF